MMGLFGPLAVRGGTVTVSRWVQQASGPTWPFYESWTAEVTSGGRAATAAYNILPPSGGKAFFHFLLDASGSTWERCSTGDRKRVYEYLLDNFASLILHNPDVVRPHDEIFVWLFNKETQLLCQGEQKDFHQQIDFIREKYRNELDIRSHYHETRLYDAVGVAMDWIREKWKTNKTADFYLVPFTDGKDNTSKISIEDMVGKLTASDVPARLHTFFITANLRGDCDLYQRLGSQSEMSLIELENSGPHEISRGFNRLREMIKAILVVEDKDRDETQTVTRIVDYASSTHDVAQHVVGALATIKMGNVSWLGALTESSDSGFGFR